MDLDTWEAQERDLKRVHRTLVRDGVLARLDRSREEWSRWVDCCLAAFAENRLGEVIDPPALDPETRARWMRDALDEPLPTRKNRDLWRCYWIVRQGLGVGTFALSRFVLSGLASGYSVYLRPGYRGRGIMTETLRTVCAALEARELGLRLETTLSLAIALDGWPLIRSGDRWQDARHSDAVQPEALAERITWWEESAAARGWRVQTPRIPGLDYEPVP